MGLAGGFVTDLRTVLRGRGFRRLFAVRVSGQLGDGVFQVAAEVPFVVTDARDRESVKEVLVRLVEHAMAVVQQG